MSLFLSHLLRIRTLRHGLFFHFLCLGLVLEYWVSFLTIYKFVLVVWNTDHLVVIEMFLLTTKTELMHVGVYRDRCGRSYVHMYRISFIFSVCFLRLSCLVGFGTLLQ